METEPIISVEGATKEFHVGASTVLALRDVDLQVAPGEFIVVMGTSGSGKTTLMQICGGLLTPDSGRVTVANRELAGLDDEELSAFRNETIGFVFQFFQLQSFYTAEENVALPLIFGNVPPAERRRRAKEALSDVGLEDRTNHRPDQMSGGEMQRVAIARAMINNPKLLLADEPTGNLDRATGERILELISAFNRERGVTVLLVTHDEKVARYAQRVIKIDNGEISE